MRGSNHCNLNESKSNIGSVELNNNNSSSNRKMFDSNESLLSGGSSVVAYSAGDFSSRRSSEEFDSRGDILEVSYPLHLFD